MNTNVTRSAPYSGDPGVGQLPRPHSCSITTLPLRKALKVASSGLSLNQVTPDKKLARVYLFETAIDNQPHLALLSHSWHHVLFTARSWSQKHAGSSPNNSTFCWSPLNFTSTGFSLNGVRGGVWETLTDYKNESERERERDKPNQTEYEPRRVTVYRSYVPLTSDS